MGGIGVSTELPHGLNPLFRPTKYREVHINKIKADSSPSINMHNCPKYKLYMYMCYPLACWFLFNILLSSSSLLMELNIFSVLRKACFSQMS